MKIEGINPETNERCTIELSDEQLSSFDGLFEENVSESVVNNYIDNLEISADAKALIHDVRRSTVQVGEHIIKIGKRIIEVVMVIVSQFPNTSFGFMLGLLLGALIGAIPILGVIFGPLLTPVLAALGVIGGLREDLRDKAVDRKIREAVAMCEPLRGTI